MLAAVMAPAVVVAQVNDFGVGGILDIPSARMNPEDELTVTYSRKDVADIYAIGYQVLPRVEVSFRYTIFNARGISPIPGTDCVANATYCDGLRDRSFEVKLKLLEESDYLPDVSVGIRDLLGTGAWGAEYLVASKRIGENLDVTAGIGWGRFAERAVSSNPLIQLDPAFGVRDTSFGVGGTVALKSFFRGPDIGAFGGLRYRIPQWRVDLLAAYNSDSYARERFFGTIPDADPLSFGVEWEATPGVRLAASWQQGNQFALKISAALNTGQTSPRKRPNGFGADRVPLKPPTELERGVGWWPRMVRDAEASGVLVREAKESPQGSLQVRYVNQTFQEEADAVRRVLTLTELYVPTRVTEVLVTGGSMSLPTHTVRYRRPNLESSALLQQPGRIELLPPQTIEAPGYVTNFRYPNGSLNDIAGIYSEKLNVLGMMPHPENLIETLVGGTDGRGLFESLSTYRGAA